MCVFQHCSIAQEIHTQTITYKFQPCLVEEGGVLSDGQYPLSSSLVSFILPERVNAFLEEMVVSILVKAAGGMNVVVCAPEIFYLERESKGVYLKSPLHLPSRWWRDC